METIFNPFTKKLQPTQEIGGKYGINVETLTGDKTLVPGIDPVYQYLDPDDTSRTITLADGRAGARFVIKHLGNWNDISFLDVKVGEETKDKTYVFATKEFIFDGTNWVGVMMGTGSFSSLEGITIGSSAQAKEAGIAIGKDTNAVLDGVAIGAGGTDAHDYGTAIGYNSDGNTNGVAVGHSAVGASVGVALGYCANTNGINRAVALGPYSRNQRKREIAFCIGDTEAGDEPKAYNEITIGSWVMETANATPTIMLVGGTAAERFTMRVQSALTFKIMVTARDNTTGDCAGYLFDGLIKRDGSNNTTLCTSNKTVLHEDDDTWDCDVAADDTNEALQITVTGDADNDVKWAARLDGVETSWTALN